MMRRWLAVVIIAAGCVVAAAAEARVVVQDMAGREVSLGATPRRIVSLVPSATEIIFALGGQDRLVGVTDYCDFPPAARRKPSVGGMVDPSLERIVALKPDLVLATREGNSEATFDQVTRLGIPIYLVIAHRVADVTNVIRRLAELTERDSAAPSLIARLDGRIAGIRKAVAPLRRPRVLYVVWPEPLIVPGRDALVTELIELAGGESITGGEAHAYPRFSVEAAVAKAPEIVVVANHGTGSGPVALEPWARLTSLIKARRVQSVDGNLLHRYGPRVVDGLEELARIIHPEVLR
jgi:iron complex transport system substrate-binding protein